MSPRAAVAGWGLALPEQIFTNDDLADRLDTSDEWIAARTGIRQRRIAAPTDDSATLAATAGAEALKEAGAVPGDVDLVVVATMTPAQAMPGNASLVQERLGLAGAAFDLNAACSGFVYALVAAGALLATGTHRCALVIGTDTMSRVVDPDDRSTAVLFGDGAAAVVLAPVEGDDGPGLLAWDLGGDPTAVGILEIRAGERYLQMEGREVFRRAVRVVVESTERALTAAGVRSSDIDLFVPHQANSRIIEAARTRLGIDAERTMTNVDLYGNTSAASVPLALAEAADAGRLADGDLVLLVGFGAGMSWASALLRWGRPGGVI
ncbi:beta-ketoacyl-ACP synthase III [soil metagenome]